MFSSRLGGRVLALALLCLLLPGGTQAQTITTSSTDGGTPLALTPGTPAGSYALSGFDNVNLYNGNLNFSLPLLHIGGRGEAGYTMMLPIEQKWRVRHVTRSDSQSHYPEINKWNPVNAGYGPGVLIGRQVNNHPCGGIGNPTTSSLTRLSFIIPDGAEIELRDQNTDGQKLISGCASGASRGTVFVSNDGSAMTFISDTPIHDSTTQSPFGPNIIYPTGFLRLRNGITYRIENSAVKWIRDRNGNQVSFNNDGGGLTITDSLNRHITVTRADLNSTFTDQITFNGANGAMRTIQVSYALLSTLLRSDQTMKTYSQLFPTLDSLGSGGFDTYRVSSVMLPDNRQYQFRYNSYGELAQVILPTGGIYEYDHDAWYVGSTDGGIVGGSLAGPEIYRRVVEKRIKPDGVTVKGRITYSSPEGPGTYAGYVTVNTYFDAGDTLLASEKHYFYGDYWSGLGASNSYAGTFDYPGWKDGREYQTDLLDADGSTALQRKTDIWQQRATVSWCTLGDGCPIKDPRIIETDSTLLDSNLVSKQTFNYDQYNNQIDVYKYDFGAGAPGPLVRRTHIDYVTLNNGVDYAADTNIHIRNLPLKWQVFDAVEKKRAETIYEYDNYNQSSPDLFHAALADCPNISGHDGSFSTTYYNRGNVTKTTRDLLDNMGSVIGSIGTYAQYDIAGNVVALIDPRSTDTPPNIIATTFDYRDNYGSPDNPAVQSSGDPANNAPSELGVQLSYAFPFKVTNALGHNAYTKYDYYLGRPVLSEDANGVKSNSYFNDALDRQTKGIRAIGTSEASQTVFVYNDNDSPVNGYPARSITTISDKDVFGESNSGDGLKSVALFDGLGRTWRGAAYEGSTWTIKDTLFDALGRVSQVSNPYRAADPGSALPPAGLWTTTNYDALGRVIQVTTPDGAHVDTAYIGNQVTVTDQAGKKRRSETDAFGRLTKVIEDPGGLSYETTYLYDALGNLRQVTQGAQYRWFAYDSLSRLIRAKNPEQDVNANPNISYTDPVTGHSGWSMAYSYDANGNLVSKTDARDFTTTYGYDALNRNTSVDYSNIGYNPDITRFYDNPDPLAYGKGRYWHDYAGGSANPNFDHTAIDSYDPLGRPKTKRQLFKRNGIVGPTYSTNQDYDLAGNVKTVRYPSDRTVNYIYDSAGRLSVFSGNLGGSPRTYADTIGYNAAGQMIKERFGANTPLYHNSHYNNRHQLVSTRVGDSATDELNWSRGAIGFYYGTTAVNTGDLFANDTDNNGNLRRQANYVPLAGGGYVISQSDNYTYDALNRINSFTEAQMNSSGQWTPNVAWQNFSYDPYGNRQITGASGGVSNYNPPYDQATNRTHWLGYDAAGNVRNDPSTGGEMMYDAENRLLTAASGGDGIYVYNADGKRVSRPTAGLQDTWYVYGCGGELLAEYTAGAQPTAPLKEYGYRGGQLLIVAESGSGGGVSFVKPTLKPSADLIGKAGVEADGDANGLLVVNEPVAALGINEGHGSITADFSDSDNTGTLMRGGPRTTAEEYGNAPSANGVGGESLAEHPAGVAPSPPQKEYGYRSGRSWTPVAAQSIVHVTPGAYQTPIVPNHLAVNSPLNTEHGSTTSYASADIGEIKSCRWFAFQPVGGQITRITLKFNWSISGNLFTNAPNPQDYAFANATFYIEYSTNNGSNWSTAIWRRELSNISPGPGGENRPFSDSGSFSIDLPSNTPINQIMIRDSISAGATSNWFQRHASSSATLTARVWNIDLEVETNPAGPPTVAPLSPAAGATNVNADANVTMTFSKAMDAATVNGSTVELRDPGNALVPATVSYNAASFTATLDPTASLARGVTYTARVRGGGADPRVKDVAGNALAADVTWTFTTTQSGIKWLVTDHLGSTRMVIDETGSLLGIKRRDFAPFGEELSAGIGIRSASLGYGDDSVHKSLRPRSTIRKQGWITSLHDITHQCKGGLQALMNSLVGQRSCSGLMGRLAITQPSMQNSRNHRALTNILTV